MCCGKGGEQGAVGRATKRRKTWQTGWGRRGKLHGVSGKEGWRVPGCHAHGHVLVAAAADSLRSMGKRSSNRQTREKGQCERASKASKQASTAQQRCVCVGGGDLMQHIWTTGQGSVSKEERGREGRSNSAARSTTTGSVRRQARWHKSIRGRLGSGMIVGSEWRDGREEQTRRQPHASPPQQAVASRQTGSPS